MTRIEKNEPVQNHIQQMKEEVIEEVKQGKKKRSPFLSCSFVIFVLLILVVLIGTWAASATGLVTVPLVSKVAFRGPEPLRFVTPGVPVETVAQSTFDTILKDRLIAGNGTLKDRSVSLMLSESSLTATLRNLLAESSMEGVKAKQSQVVIRDDRDVFELFVPISYNKRESAIVADVAVLVQDGVMDLELEQIHIGSLRAPKFLIASLIQPMINEQLTSLNQSLGSYVRVDAVSYKEGSITIDGTFTVQVKN